MKRIAIACACAFYLGGCATTPPAEGRAWMRIDGRAVASQQTQAEVSICQAAAVNAGRGGVTNNSGVYVNTGDENSGGVVGFIDKVGQRNRAESATMDACMAQRGYVRAAG